MNRPATSGGALEALERARRAQEAHDRRTNVQLRLDVAGELKQAGDQLDQLVTRITMLDQGGRP